MTGRSTTASFGTATTTTESSIMREFARGKSHVKGIECFWSYPKRRLAKFNGLTDAKSTLHLKESVCRFNHGIDNFASFIEQIF